MKIYCIGDSLTQGDYGVYQKRCIANVKEKGYPYFLKELTGAEVTNAGKCGFTATTYVKLYKTGFKPTPDTDLIIIMLGTNGGLDACQETEGNADYRELVELCKKDAPRAKIFLVTPPHCTKNPEYSNCGFSDRVEKAVEFLLKYKDEANLPLIPLHLCPDFTEENEAVMQSNDGLHFSELGYKTMAEFIYEALKKNGVI